MPIIYLEVEAEVLLAGTFPCNSSISNSSPFQSSTVEPLVNRIPRPDSSQRCTSPQRFLHNLHFLHKLFSLCSLQFMTVPIQAGSGLSTSKARPSLCAEIA